MWGAAGELRGELVGVCSGRPSAYTQDLSRLRVSWIAFLQGLLLQGFS